MVAEKKKVGARIVNITSSRNPWKVHMHVENFLRTIHVLERVIYNLLLW